MIFSGRPHTLAPLTTDHDWLQSTPSSARSTSDHNIAQATAIGSRPSLPSAKRLSDREAKSKVVVLVTDGDQTVPGPQPRGRRPPRGHPRHQSLSDRHRNPGQALRSAHQRRYLEQSFNLPTLEKVAEIDWRANPTSGQGHPHRSSAFSQKSTRLEKSEVERRTFNEIGRVLPVARRRPPHCWRCLGLAWETRPRPRRTGLTTSETSMDPDDIS